MTALEIWLQESSTNTHVGEIPPGQNLPQVKTNCNKSKYLHSFHLRNKFTFDSGHAQLKWCTERTHVNCPKRRPLVRICPKRKHLPIHPLTRTDIIMRNADNVIRQRKVYATRSCKASCLDKENKESRMPSPVGPPAEQRKKGGLSAKKTVQWFWCIQVLSQGDFNTTDFEKGITKLY